jgi:hypothetical protein
VSGEFFIVIYFNQVVIVLVNQLKEIKSIKQEFGGIDGISCVGQKSAETVIFFFANFRQCWDINHLTLVF